MIAMILEHKHACVRTHNLNRYKMYVHYLSQHIMLNDMQDIIVSKLKFKRSNQLTRELNEGSKGIPRRNPIQVPRTHVQHFFIMHTDMKNLQMLMISLRNLD